MVLLIRKDAGSHEMFQNCVKSVEFSPLFFIDRVRAINQFNYGDLSLLRLVSVVCVSQRGCGYT